MKRRRSPITCRACHVCVLHGACDAAVQTSGRTPTALQLLRGDVRVRCSRRRRFSPADQLFGAFNLPAHRTGHGEQRPSGRHEAGGRRRSPGGRTLDASTNGAASADVTAPLPASASSAAPTIHCIDLRAFATQFDGRVLLAGRKPRPARNDARVLRRIRLPAQRSATMPKLRGATDELALRRPAARRLRLKAESLALITESRALCRRCRQRAQARSTRVRRREAMLRDLSEVKVGDPVVHEQHGIGRYLGLHDAWIWAKAPREFLTLEYAERRQALRAGVAAASDQPLQRRVAGSGAAAHARRRAVGEGEAQGRASRCATPRPSCSTCMRSAHARQGHAFELDSSTTTKRSRDGFRSRRRPTRRRRSTRSSTT